MEVRNREEEEDARQCLGLMITGLVHLVLFFRQGWGTHTSALSQKQSPLAVKPQDPEVEQGLVFKSTKALFKL